MAEPDQVTLSPFLRGFCCLWQCCLQHFSSRLGHEVEHKVFKKSTKMFLFSLEKKMILIFYKMTDHPFPIFPIAETT